LGQVSAYFTLWRRIGILSRNLSQKPASFNSLIDLLTVQYHYQSWSCIFPGHLIMLQRNSACVY